MLKFTILTVATALAALLLLWPWEIVPSDGTAAFLWNWGHALLFGVISWVLSKCGSRGTSTWQHPARDLGLLFLAAVGIEILQGFTGRTQDWRDVASGLLGATAGTSWGIATNPGPMPSHGRLVALLVSGVSVAFSLQPLATHLLALREYARQYPVLSDFEGGRSLTFWFLELNGMRVPLTHSGIPTKKKGSETSRRIELRVPAYGHLSLHHSTQGRNWRPATALTFDYEMRATGEPLRLGVRIDGAQNSLRLESLLRAGKHHARIVLPRAATSDTVLAETNQLVLFTQDPRFDAILYLDNFRLELE